MIEESKLKLEMYLKSIFMVQSRAILSLRTALHGSGAVNKRAPLTTAIRATLYGIITPIKLEYNSISMPR